MSYSTKNYTEQGGEKTVIGGTLEIKEGGSVTGLPTALNQAASTASTVAGVKDGLNELLIKLKDARLMSPDKWNISAANIETSGSEEFNTNQSKVSDISTEGNVITLTVHVSELVAYPSSNPAQGTHKWVGILITTGLADITVIEYNGYQLTADDVAEAVAFGGTGGDIVMWLKCDEIVDTPKLFILRAPGYAETEFKVVIAEPEEE